MIVLDSGLGGLSVVRALKEASPGIGLTYVADTAGFPYGDRDGAWLIARAHALIAALKEQDMPPLVVLACNTLSTAALEALRERWDLAFVGTVPAIKVAAGQSKTHRFTLLATPNTAGGEYVNGLIGTFAAHCTVDCYGAPHLAAYAEKLLLGESVSGDTLRKEVAPCFHDDARGKTDMVILGCTHYPLIVEQLDAAAPWPVSWIDPSPAIARRALSQASATQGPMRALVTDKKDLVRYEAVFRREGFAGTALLAV